MSHERLIVETFLILLLFLNKYYRTMSKHPINLALRFILEITALVVFGFWGWKLLPGSLGLITAIAFPLIAATLWGVFAVKDDPSRSGKTVIPTPGILRLVLELVFFALASLAFYNLEQIIITIVFSILVLLHYLSSLDRIIWLLKH